MPPNHFCARAQVPLNPNSMMNLSERRKQVLVVWLSGKALAGVYEHLRTKYI